MALYSLLKLTVLCALFQAVAAFAPLPELPSSVESGACSINWKCPFEPKTCWDNCKCPVCKTILGAVEGAITSQGCAAADAEVDAICETTFLGDPVSSLCVKDWNTACPIIAEEIGKVTDPTALCEKASLCDSLNSDARGLCKYLCEAADSACNALCPFGDGPCKAACSVVENACIAAC